MLPPSSSPLLTTPRSCSLLVVLGAALGVALCRSAWPGGRLHPSWRRRSQTALLPAWHERGEASRPTEEADRTDKPRPWSASTAESAVFVLPPPSPDSNARASSSRVQGRGWRQADGEHDEAQAGMGNVNEKGVHDAPLLSPETAHF